jgi:hypothetical protein
MISMLYLLPLLGMLLFGLVQLAIGVVLLFKVKNKLAGGLVVAGGAAFTVIPILFSLTLIVIWSVQG